jgi:PAS domain-containing protein
MSPVGISRVNNFGQVIYGNPRWMEISGHRGADEDFSGQSLLELVHPDDRQTMEELWKYALQNSKKIAFELKWGTPDLFVWGMGELVPEIVDDEVQYPGSLLTISAEDLSVY